MNRRAVLLAAGLAAGGSLASTRPAVAAAPLATVSVDLSASLGAFPFGLGRQVSATPKSWNHGPATLAALEALRLQRVRVWLKFKDNMDLNLRTPAYQNAYQYLDTYHARAGTLVLNWQSEYSPLVTGGSWSRSDLLTATTNMIAHYKTRCPKIEYVEVENEEIWHVRDVPAYYLKYKMMYEVVNAVNAMGLAGPRLKVGGPTLDTFSEWRLGAFLDAYRADASAAKRLDFISYHQYLINTVAGGDWTDTKFRPAAVATERARTDTLLRDRGLPVVPILVTETGVFPMNRASTLGLEADWHIQAAALASMHYYYAGQRDVVPLDWTLDHPDNDRKDLFVSLATGVPRPYYNAMRMFSMLPEIRFRATSDQLEPRGIGVYGLAGASGSTVAAMTWNYQWTNQTSYDSRVVFTNLGGAFRTSNVRVTRYRIAADVHEGPLTPLETITIGPRTAGTYYGQTLPLNANELRLTVLTPIA